MRPRIHIERPLPTRNDSLRPLRNRVDSRWRYHRKPVMAGFLMVRASGGDLVGHSHSAIRCEPRQAGYYKLKVIQSTL